MKLVLARWTGQPSTDDPAVDETYEGLVAVTTFGREVLGRDPLAERPLIAFVHYGAHYNNAFWNGEELILGDGDGEIFGRFSQCLDVIAGEVWHGVEEMLHYFDWSGEHGALHTSLADVFGQLAKQYTLNQTVEEADWICGAGLLAPGINGVGLRSLKAPGTAYDDRILGQDPQPTHMDAYVRTHKDQGGIHINSGIPNHAFYLVAQRLGGKAWEGAGRIWWDALTGDGLREGLLFADWARLTATAARTRHGTDSVEYRAVLDAWNRVGVPVVE
ncbi:M4 family metallopeptidase [Streptomyces sp. NPDC059866]|uniref:M4 family metallopeptidase n=1 Tax=Streptomyces sp. NPDC059866 TaxID=3346978 RepID=UPI00365E4757